MRSVGGLLPQIITHENLTAAVWLAAKGRREQPVVMRYLESLDEQLETLREQIHSGGLHCGECLTFTIHDPKERQITAPVFRERVLHHAIMRVCGPVLDRRLIHHSYACRAGKGTHAALEAARAAARRGEWFVKLDVRKYFASIPHVRLLERLERVFRERRVLELFRVILAAYAPMPGCGLPIGTLVSQHLANFYLSSLDALAVQDLRPCGYVRYMDDMALWASDRRRALDAREKLVAFATNELGLKMKTAFINRSSHGMDFLGHRVFPQRLILNRTSRRRYARRVRTLGEQWQNGCLCEPDAQERAVALTAVTMRADSLAWRRKVLQSLGGRTKVRTVCYVAAPGSTMAGTPAPASATGTSLRTATGTSACVSPPAPAGGRSARMEQSCHPVPRPCAVDETTEAPPPVSSPRCSHAPGQHGRRGHFSNATLT